MFSGKLLICSGKSIYIRWYIFLYLEMNICALGNPCFALEDVFYLHWQVYRLQPLIVLASLANLLIDNREGTHIN